MDEQNPELFIIFNLSETFKYRKIHLSMGWEYDAQTT